MAIFYRRPAPSFVTLEILFRRLPHMPAFDGQSASAGARARLAASVLAFFRWRAVVAQPIPAKAVVIFYPHTSNWDFVIGLLAKWALELDVHWVGKDSLFHGPLRAVFRRWGGIAVNRSERTGSIARLADEFSARKRFLLALAPEGTRQRAEHWRSGFYYLALVARVPLALAFIDYPRREVGVAGYLEPGGDPDRDIAAIAAFYAGKTGRKPPLQSPIRFESAPSGD
jgi:1-acyl-sn-glycerol-3-phosphate acyltransferase